MSDNEQWASCPAGTFRRLQGQFTSEARQRTLNPYLGGAALVVLVAAVFFGFSLLKSDPTSPLPMSRLACRQVLPLLPSYHDGTLEAGVRRQVGEHLAYCQSCQQAYETQFANATVRRQAQPRSLVSMPLLGATTK